MNTQNAVTETRNVTPQWKGENGGNLGEHKVTVVPFTTDTLKTMMDKHGEHVADIMNAQCSIKFLGPEFVRQVSMALPDREEGQKLEAWQEANRKDALAIAKDVAQMVFDFPALFSAWASKERSTRDKRTPMAGFETLIENVTMKWDNVPIEKRAAMAAKYKLGDVAEKDSAHVLGVIRAMYRPALAVTADDL